MRTHGQICVRTQILHMCKICIRMQNWSCVHGLSMQLLFHLAEQTCLKTILLETQKIVFIMGGSEQIIIIQCLDHDG